LLSSRIREGLPLGGVLLRQLPFQLGAKDNDAGTLFRRNLPDDVDVFVAVGEVVLGHVRGVENGLGRQEEERFEPSGLLVAYVEAADGLALGQMIPHSPIEGKLLAKLLVAALRLLLRALDAPFDGLQVFQQEFGFDDLDIAPRIDRAGYVHDVGVLEAAYDMHDGVDLADVRQELIAETFAAGGAGDEARDVDELDGRRRHLRGSR